MTYETISLQDYFNQYTTNYCYFDESTNTVTLLENICTIINKVKE